MRNKYDLIIVSINDLYMKEFEGKKLLVLGGITLACDIVKHAQAMGAYVAVADYNIDSPAKAIADEAVLLDATDIEAIVEYCKANKIDGVTTGFIDILMPICYKVCKLLNLPYYATEKMISMSTDKNDFKETCFAHGVPVPVTYLNGSVITEDIYKFIEYPVFVKPLDSSGSRGCGICKNRIELDKQFSEALSYSSSNTAIIEQCLVGREFLLDYIAVDGEFRLLEMFDRYVCSDRGSAINYANLSIAPSKSLNLYMQSVNSKVIKMFKDLGITDGLIFLQGHVNGENITFYEMGCRLGGAFYNCEQACIGINAIDMVVRYALKGKMVDNINEIPTSVANFSKYGLSYNFLLNQEEGIIANIEGIDVMKNLPSYITSIHPRGVGFHNVKDRTVDKPVITIHMACDSIEQVKNDIKLLNDNIKVTNTHGKSMLMQVFDPNNL